MITVVETSQFVKRSARVWTEEERDEFVDYIARNPEAGVIVAGTGGIRKVRWLSQGRGKRGGVRVVYFYHSLAMPLFLLDFYAKNEKSDLNSQDKQLLGALVDNILRRVKS